MSKRFIIDEAHLILDFHKVLRDFSALERLAFDFPSAGFTLSSGTFPIEDQKVLCKFLSLDFMSVKLVYVVELLCYCFFLNKTKKVSFICAAKSRIACISPARTLSSWRYEF